MFVKLGESKADDFKLAMHRSVGGQTVVFCDCCDNNPLIITGRRKENKRRCIKPGCNHREKLICSNIKCATRICSTCFDEYRSSTEDIILSNLPMGDDDAELAADRDSEYI